MSVMLYSGDGETKLHGVMVDYVIVDEEDVGSFLKKGYYETPIEADEAISKDESNDDIETEAPTRKEMEDKAKELEIKFPANIKDSTLLKKINEKLDELD